MKLLNSRMQYGLVSRALHWFIVLAILAQWLLADAGEESGTTGSVFEPMSLHQSIGLLILPLAVVRLAWRWMNPFPAWPADMKPWEIRVAHLVHVAFYVLLFAIPLSGWALASAEDAPLRFFDWFDVPRLRAGGEEALEDLHELLFNVLAGLALLHVIGAARHWIARRQGRHAWRDLPPPGA